MEAEGRESVSHETIFSIPDTDGVPVSTICMPRRESVLTLASEGFSEQSCVTNSSYLSFKTVAALEDSDNLTNTNLYAIVVRIYSKAVVKTKRSDWKFSFVRTAPHGGTDYLFVKLRQLFELRKYFYGNLREKWDYHRLLWRMF